MSESPPLNTAGDADRVANSGIAEQHCRQRENEEEFRISNVMAISVIYLTYSGMLLMRFTVKEMVKFINQEKRIRGGRRR